MGWFSQKSTVKPDYTQAQVQTSSSMMPIPWAAGTNRVVPNLIYLDNFQSHAVKKGGKGGSCFVGETVVSTPAGGRRIDRLREGDPIFCVDPATGARIIGRILKILVHPRDDVAPVKLLMFRHERGRIRGVTANHWLWDDSRSNQREAGSYYPGDEIWSEKYGPSRITSIEEIEQVDVTYNLIVSPYSNYFADGVLVHNGGGGKTTGYTYSASIILGLTNNPNGASYDMGVVWNGQSKSSFSTTGYTFDSSGDVVDWSYTWNSKPAQALAYNAATKVYATDHDFGSSATPATEQFEIGGAYRDTGVNGAGDASPPTILWNFLWGESSGSLGFPEFAKENLLSPGDDDAGAFGLIGVSKVTDTTGYSSIALNNNSWYNYCTAIGVDLSVLLSSQEQASSFVSRISQLTNTAIFWNGRTIKAVPYGDTVVAGNGFTYTPNLTPKYDFTEDDFCAGSDGDPSNNPPITISRKDPATVYNTYSLEWLNRSNDYQAEPIYTHDQASLDYTAYSPTSNGGGWQAYGIIDISPRSASIVQAHEIRTAGVARTVVELIKQREVAVRNTFTFTVPWIYCDLEPMDIVTLTDSHTDLSAYPVRITKIEESIDDGIITITAEDMLIGSNASTAGTIAVASNATNSNAAAPAVHPPVIFEPPSALTSNTLQIWIAASGGPAGTYDSNWGGCEVWCSLDGVDYSYFGKISKGCRTGYLTTAITAGDTTATVDMTESDGEIDAGSYTDTAATLCYLDGEFINFTSSTLVSTYSVTLGGLTRGLYSIAAKTHAVNAQFCRVDSTVEQFTYDASYIGKTVYIKLQSFNIFGKGIQDISDCAVYQFTPTGISSTNH